LFNIVLSLSQTKPECVLEKARKPRKIPGKGQKIPEKTRKNSEKLGIFRVFPGF
jgi:hypothetical protein